MCIFVCFTANHPLFRGKRIMVIFCCNILFIKTKLGKYVVNMIVDVVKA